ncbi:MAG: methyltransferase domain-containing protein [Gemmatimonadaceae bacterium]
MLTPTRRRGFEILDDPSVDPAVRAQSIGDVTRSNQLLGGLRAAAAAVREVLRVDPSCRSVLDVGTGLADIPGRVRHEAKNAGISLETFGVDEASSLLVAARDRLGHAVCANALALPFRDHSIDIVMCSQLLHHFETADAERLVAELARVARRAVIVSDLRRSWIAAAGFWLVSFPLRFHRVTRHDGVVSVMRGFTDSELARIMRNATGRPAVLNRRLGFRLTARWTHEEFA